MGRAVQIPTAPQRVVSLVPSQTELLIDLGLEAEVVGVTKFCVHPEGLRREKAVVGGTKQIRLDDLLALAPDLVLANKEENTEAMVRAISAHAPVYVTDVSTVAEGLEMIRAVGEITDRGAAGAALAAEISTGFEALRDRWAADPIAVAYLIWRGPYMAAGGQNFIDDVLRWGGLINVFGDTPRYPEITLEALAAAAPERILLSSEPYPFTAAHAAEIEAACPSAVALVDGEPFSWYGSRMRHTPAYLAALRAQWAGEQGA